MWKSYIFIALIITAVLFALGIVCILVWAGRRKKEAQKRVLERSDEEKLKDFKTALTAVGFDYDMAGVMNMVIDCEPIPFFCHNRYWLIELWKGQYGMAAGAEIGIYMTEEGRRKPDFFDGTLYQCVDERDYMEMEFILYKT